MPIPRLLAGHRSRILPAVSARDVRPALDAMPAETRRVVRLVGSLLAAGALLLAFAAAAQTAAYGPGTESGGALAWVFAGFAGAAVLAVFLVVLSLVRTPSQKPDPHLPGTARDR